MNGRVIIPRFQTRFERTSCDSRTRSYDRGVCGRERAQTDVPWEMSAETESHHPSCRSSCRQACFLRPTRGANNSRPRFPRSSGGRRFQPTARSRLRPNSRQSCSPSGNRSGPVESFPRCSRPTRTGNSKGRNAKGQSNDWHKWDGTAMGYEGFLVDGYLTLLAALDDS